MKRNYSIWITIISFLALSSCHDDRFGSTIEQGPSLEPTINIESGFTLQVLDENRIPLEGAQVEIGDSFLGNTDENGLFILNQKVLRSTGDLVKVNASGYFSGSRVVYPRLGERAHLLVEMLPLNNTLTIDGSAGGEIILSGSGAKITLEADGVIRKNDGSAYSGMVNVAAHYLDPTDYRTLDQMPGDLSAINDQNEEVTLISYSMLAVELRGQNDEELNIASGKKAILEFPVDPSLLSDAPAEIPLWFFNEEIGKWQEEGKATLQGNVYVGEVSHFSFWNCDVPGDFVNFSIRVLNNENIPIPQLRIHLTVIGSGISSSGLTNDYGITSGLIPANESFRMDVLSSCGDLVYTEQIGPFTTDFNYGDLVINDDLIAMAIRIKGQILDCDSNPVTNGYATIKINQTVSVAYPNADGNFETVVLECGTLPNSLTIQTVDLDNLLASEELPFTITSNSVDAGSIVTCGQADFIYFVLHIDTSTINFPETEIRVIPVDFGQPGLYSIDVSKTDQAPVDGPAWYLGIPDCLDASAVGNYSQNYHITYNYTIGFAGLFQFVDGTHTINWEITQVPDGNGFVKGSFSGSVLLENRINPDENKIVDMSGEFSLYIEE